MKRSALIFVAGALLVACGGRWMTWRAQPAAPAVAGKIMIKQSEVTAISTDAPVAVRLASGTRFDGKVTATPGGGIQIAGSDGTIRPPHPKAFCLPKALAGAALRSLAQFRLLEALSRFHRLHQAPTAAKGPFGPGAPSP